MAPEMGPEDQDPMGAARGDRWIRRAGITVGSGVAVGILGALGVGVAGGSGQVGAVVALLVLSMAVALAGLMALVSSVVEEFRGGDVPWPRPVLGVVLFVVAAALMGMTVAAAG